MAAWNVRVLAQTPPCPTDFTDFIFLTQPATVQDLPDPNQGPQKLVVFYSITFDQSYTFLPGSEIIMLTPSSSLIVENGYVVFDGTTIRGCEDSWDKIEVKAGTSISIKNSAIYNSCGGVKCYPRSAVEIVESIFLDNWRCLEAIGGVIVFGNGIAHNTFKRARQYTVFCGSENDTRAILLTGVPYFPIGDMAQSGQPNVILDYQYGIDAQNSNIEVVNTRIKTPDGEEGIRLRGTTGVFNANIKGLGGSVSSPTFIEGFKRGIDLKRYHLSVEEGLFKKNDERAIYMFNSGAPSFLRLHKSRFESYGQEAIGVFNSPLTGAIVSENEARDNSDTEDYEKTFVMWYNSNLALPSGEVRIRKNKHYDDEKPPAFLKRISLGVFLTNINGRIIIEDNEFYQNHIPLGDHEFRGVFLYNSPDNKLIQNKAIGNFGFLSTTQHLYQGIQTRETTYSLVSCNTTSGLNRGFDFTGICDHTDFRYNVMSDNAVGLYLYPGSVIGQQYEKENRWPGDLPPGGQYEALYDGMPSLFMINASKFFINDPDILSNFWANPRQPLDLFEFSGGTPSGILSCIEEHEEGEWLSAGDEMAISGTFPAYKGYPASGWEAEFRAFATLTEHPNLRPTGSMAEAFYTVRENSTLDSLYRAKRDWERLFRFTPALENAWTDNQAAVEDKLEELQLLTEQMQAAQTHSERQTLAQSIAQRQDELVALQQTTQSLSGQYADLIATRAQLLATDLAAIEAGEAWEQNLKTVLALQVERVLSGAESWTTEQYNALQTIADQCRHEGGIGVVMARAAIGQINYNDEAMCPGYVAPRSRAETAIPTARLMPNPASDRCRLVFEQSITGTLQIFNPQGQMVQQTLLKETTAFDVETRSLPAGVYQINVRTDQGVQVLSRMSVVH